MPELQGEKLKRVQGKDVNVALPDNYRNVAEFWAAADKRIEAKKAQA